MRRLVIAAAAAVVLALTGCGTQQQATNDSNWGTHTVTLPSGRVAECVLYVNGGTYASTELSCFLVPEDVQLPTLSEDQ